MSDAGDALKKAAEAVRKGAGELGDAAAAAVAKAGDAAAEAAGPALQDATKRLGDAVTDPESGQELLHALEAAAHELSEVAALYAKRAPIKSILVAAAVGAVAMALIELMTRPPQRRQRIAQSLDD